MLQKQQNKVKYIAGELTGMALNMLFERGLECPQPWPNITRNLQAQT